jgi:hypothetical protein
MVQGNIFKKFWTQGNCGLRKKLATAGRKMTRCAKVAQCKARGLQGHSHEGLSIEQGRWKNQTRNKFARGTWKGRTLGRRQLMIQEGTNGTRNCDFEEQLWLESERTTSEFDRKAFRLELMKRATGMFSGLQKVRDWAVWRYRRPPERENKDRML